MCVFSRVRAGERMDTRVRCHIVRVSMRARSRVCVRVVCVRMRVCASSARGCHWLLRLCAAAARAAGRVGLGVVRLMRRAWRLRP